MHLVLPGYATSTCSSIVNAFGYAALAFSSIPPSHSAPPPPPLAILLSHSAPPSLPSAMPPSHSTPPSHSAPPSPPLASPLSHSAPPSPPSAIPLSHLATPLSHSVSPPSPSAMPLSHSAAPLSSLYKAISPVPCPFISMSTSISIVLALVQRALNSAFDCILGSSTFLVIFSTCPTGLFFVFSRSCSPPAEGSSKPQIPRSLCVPVQDIGPHDQIARSCQLVCPSSRYRANTKVAWGIRGFRYSWSPAGFDNFPCRPPHTCAGLAIHHDHDHGSRGRRTVCTRRNAPSTHRGG